MSPLKRIPIGQAAQAFAEYLAQTENEPYAGARNEPWDRTTKTGYQHCIILENIAYGTIGLASRAGDVAGDFAAA